MPKIANSGGGYCGDYSFFMGMLPSFKREILEETENANWEKLYKQYQQVYKDLYNQKAPINKESFKNKLLHFDLTSQDKEILNAASLGLRQIIRNSHKNAIYDKFTQDLRQYNELNSDISNKLEDDPSTIELLDLFNRVFQTRQMQFPELRRNEDDLKTNGAYDNQKIRDEISYHLGCIQRNCYVTRINNITRAYRQGDPEGSTPSKLESLLTKLQDTRQMLDQDEINELDKLAIKAIENAEYSLFCEKSSGSTFNIHAKATKTRYMDQNSLQCILPEYFNLDLEENNDTSIAVKTTTFAVKQTKTGSWMPFDRAHFETILTDEAYNFCQQQVDRTTISKWDRIFSQGFDSHILAHKFSKSDMVNSKNYLLESLESQKNGSNNSFIDAKSKIITKIYDSQSKHESKLLLIAKNIYRAENPSQLKNALSRASFASWTVGSSSLVFFKSGSRLYNSIQKSINEDCNF
ncbi:MAG: hypothetical protein EP298_01500 [Gammaproteobacteria bacterium]|nr:MAG: hypothetical protein EP298_01500 [Gammaproteobacteria bacterium]UTW43881.1 hypothetical protein KFE69_07270 [bacterium SCSIO 12844]